MYITALDRVKKTELVMEGAVKVWKQIPLGRSEDVPGFSFRVFTIEPGGHTPYHSHDFEHLNYIIEGQGAVVDRDKREHLIKQGDFVLVKPGETHNYINNSGDKNLVVICAVPKDYE